MQTHWQHGGFVRPSKIFLEIDSHFYVAVVRGTTPGRATKLLYSVPEGSRNSNQDQISFYVWLYLIDWDNVSEYHLSDRQSLDHFTNEYTILFVMAIHLAARLSPYISLLTLHFSNDLDRRFSSWQGCKCSSSLLFHSLYQPTEYWRRIVNAGRHIR